MLLRSINFEKITKTIKVATYESSIAACLKKIKKKPKQQWCFLAAMMLFNIWKRVMLLKNASILGTLIYLNGLFSRQILINILNDHFRNETP